MLIKNSLYALCLWILLTTVPYISSADSFLQGGQQTGTGMDTGMFEYSPTRHKIDLSGTWQVSVNGSEPISVNVPSSYDGVAELVYERTFDVPSEYLERSGFLLVAYGINYSSEVTVNGVSIGGHVGGYTSFQLPIRRDILRPHDNTIIIRVNNVLRPRDTLPIKAQLRAPKNYGGIFRDIYVLVVPDRSILDKEIRTAFLDGYSVAELNLEIAVGRGDLTAGQLWLEDSEEERATYHLVVEVIDRLRGNVIAQTPRRRISFEEAGIVRENIQLIVRNPRLWSPEQPDLYTISTVLLRNGEEYDRKNLIYGFRELMIRDGNIYINGRRFRGRGILYHEYHPASGSTLSYEQLERDVALMKVANINLVRVAFHPPHPYLLNLFNRYGMLCLIEIPAINVPGSLLKSESFQQTAQAYLRQTILRDRHHPSVLGWGIGDNIEMPHRGAAQYVQAMKSLAERLDDRPLYAGSQFPSNDVATAYLDLAVLNIPPGKIYRVAESVDLWRDRHKEKPIIIGQLGYYVQPNNTGGYNHPASYEAQAWYLAHMMQQLRDREIDGLIVNSFTDWRSERPSMALHSDDLTLHTTGVFDGGRHQRRSYEVVRALYRGERIPPLSAGEAPGSTPFEYILGGFLVLIGFAYLLNSSRRFRENVTRSLLRPYNFYSDVRDQRILSGFHTVYLGLFISLTMAMIFSGFLQHYRTNQIVDYIFTHFLITDSLKAILANAVAETWKLIALLTVFNFFVLVIIALVVRVGSVTVRRSVTLTHSFIITFWSTLPLAVFIPLSMILYNVLENEAYALPILGFVGIMFVWVLFRLLKGVSIIYDVLTFRVYVIGLFVLVSVNGIMLVVSEYIHATFSYISFFAHMFEGFRF